MLAANDLLINKDEEIKSYILSLGVYLMMIIIFIWSVKLYKKSNNQLHILIW